MHRIAALATVSTVALTAVVLSGGAASARGGGSGGGTSTGGSTAGGTASGTWPSSFPLPMSPGTLRSQSATSASVRSTDSVVTVKNKLDSLYVTGMGCTLKLVVNKPKDYFCTDPATGKTREIFFTFAALDPTAADPSISQTNAFLG